MAITGMSRRQQLVQHVQELERLEAAKKAASAALAEAFKTAALQGFDGKTLKVVLALRKMTPEQRQERRALEAIYMAALGMLEGDALPEAARRRLDPDPTPPSPGEGQESRHDEPSAGEASAAPELPPAPQLPLKTPDEARAEGEAAAAAGKRIFDNPYPAGDPCRASWDEGWCARAQSHGMETPSAYQRRSAKPPKEEKDEPPDDKGHGGGA